MTQYNHDLDSNYDDFNSYDFSYLSDSLNPFSVIGVGRSPPDLTLDKLVIRLTGIDTQLDNLKHNQQDLHNALSSLGIDLLTVDDLSRHKQSTTQSLNTLKAYLTVILIVDLFLLVLLILLV